MSPETLPAFETLETSKLLEHLDTSDWRIQEAVGRVVEARGAESVPFLVQGLSHRGWRVRRSCALLLDHLADHRCVLPLVAALEDPVENVRRNALHSLMCQRCKPQPLQGDVVAALVRSATSDRSLRVRRIAVQALGEQGYDPRSAAALEQLRAADPDPVIRTRAGRALLALGG